MNYGGWTMPQLKAELRLRGASFSGRKAELLERLQSHGRNKDVGGSPSFEDSHDVHLPPLHSYKDINADSYFVFLSYCAINHYLAPFNKKISTRVKDIYNNRCLKYLRLSHHDNLFYFKAECCVDVKRRVVHHIDVSVDADGSVVGGRCGCFTGRGPLGHCRHVAAVLYAVHKFSVVGEVLLGSEDTRTPSHRSVSARKSHFYKGSPMKACDLPFAKNEKNSIFDPRPLKYRNMVNYRDHFRNTWLNFPGVNSLPVSQLFPPANPHAVDMDHDYEKCTIAAQWLRSNNISQISKRAIEQIEQSTRVPSHNKDEYRKRIISSNFSKICLATEESDFQNLARSLTKPEQDNTSLQEERKYQSEAIKIFDRCNGQIPSRCGMFVSFNHPYLAASPTAFLGADEVLEIDCPHAAMNRVISGSTVPYLKLEDGKLTLEKSQGYYYHIQGQLYCTGRHKCTLVVYTLADLQCISVARDECFIEKMVAELEVFYKRFFRSAVLDEFYFRNYYSYSFQY